MRGGGKKVVEGREMQGKGGSKKIKENGERNIEVESER